MRRFWAVARHTFIEIVRLRTTTIFLLALAAILLLVPAISGGGTPRDRVQTFLVYSMGLATVVLSLLTILAGCRIVCGEQARKYVFAPLTKPVSRWVYVLGRWTGLAMFQVLLVAAVGTAVYGTAQVMRRQVSDPLERHLLDNQVFAARVRVAPTSFEEDLPVRTREILDRMRQGGRLEGLGATELEGAYASAALAARQSLQTVQPLGRLQWRFTGLPVPADERASVEFHFIAKATRAPAGAGLHGVWLFADTAEGEFFRWPVALTGGVPQTFPVDQEATLLLPAQIVGRDGRMAVEFLHVRPNDPAGTFQTTITLDPEDMYMIYPVARFEANFLRAALLVLFGQMFLGSTTLLAGTWLSFPVSCMACFMVYGMGLMRSFLVEATQIRYKSGFWTYLGRYVYGGLKHLMPDFTLIGTSSTLVDGLLIPWPRVAVAGVVFVVVWTGLSLAIASFIFSRRELAGVMAE